MVVIQNILLVRAISGPLLAFTINTIYCQGTATSNGASCYSPQLFVVCVFAVLITVVVICEVIVSSLFFFSRNPLETNCMGHPNLNYMLSKCFMKALFPALLMVSVSLKLSSIFMVLIPIIWAVYLLFHRVNSLHSFSPIHFYIEYFQ